MTVNHAPRVVIFAGPNGAGKSTHADAILKAQGYYVAIYYFALTSSRLALQRVRLRVALGGHDVPAEVVKRRYGRSLHNFFQAYADLADEWIMFDNSSGESARAIARKFNAKQTIEDTALWLKLQKQSRA